MKIPTQEPVNHRISAIKGDKDCITYPGNRYKVYLDGELIAKDCTVADPVAGMITVHVRDNEGKLIIEGTGDERRIKTEDKFGDVKILFTKFRKIS